MAHLTRPAEISGVSAGLFPETAAGNPPCKQSLSFACSILAFSRKALHESSKIFIEYALHVARIQSRTQA